MSPVDAKKRDIRDGDLVRVYSAAGETVIPAYVTSRVTPGHVHVFHAGHYTPSDVKTDLMPDGVDRGGNASFLIEDTIPTTLQACLDAGSVEVEKFDF
jgi:anaerobic selenocysteine-containing dehydrogenase